ncbi:hypothetical protein [Streptomyces sp. NPDC046685]|uniref:hypothetical protein n=1 Tax=Streptomyces sp. NPDC046685 TaxID=3157202 RepID=UPI0033DD45EA
MPDSEELTSPPEARIKVMKNKKAIAAVASCTGLSVLAGLFLWWDTNVFAATELCAGKLTGEQAESVLDTRGRISEGSQEGSDDDASFRCTVSRTSRITGAKELEMVVNTAVYTPDFPFHSPAWKNVSSMSFLPEGVTGAVSGTRGWVLLPEACQDKVGVLVGKKILPRSGEVPVVQAELKRGTVDPQKLTSMLVDTAQKVAAAAGCSTNTPVQIPKVRQPPASRQAITDGSVCQIPGFRLPTSATSKDAAQLEEQRAGGARSGSWVCDLYESGQTEAQLSFGFSDDPNIAGERLRANSYFRDLPDGTGVVDGRRGAILKCADKDIYFAVRWNRDYLDSVKDPYLSGQARREVFQAFLDAAGKQHGCPSVQIPAG